MVTRRKFVQSLAALGILSAPLQLAAGADKPATSSPTPTPALPTDPAAPIPQSALTGRNCDPYTTEPYFERRWNEVGHRMAFKGSTRQEWEAWQEEARKKLGELLGLHLMQKAPLNPKVTGEEDCGDHIRQRIELQTEPGVIMPLFALIPKTGKPPFQALVAPQGHDSAGKFNTAGMFRSIPQIAKSYADYHDDYGLQMVRAGFITFCHDSRGLGERQEKYMRDNAKASSCFMLNHMAINYGLSTTGMWTWDILRLIDYILTRPDCIPGGVGCGGLSGGGLQTLYAAAMDTRIKAACISGYYSGFKGIFAGTNCACNYIPHMYENFDMDDLACLIAPRGLVIESSTGDYPGGSMDMVRQQLEKPRKVYRMLGIEDKVKHDIFPPTPPGTHQWHGPVAYEMFRKCIS